MIPEPDEVVYMRDEPFEVPATGVVDYQNFVVDPGWKEDKWITAIEPRPGNPAVVHHILIFVLPPDGNINSGLGSGNDFLGAYAPGLRPEPLNEGLARFVPAGSKLIFQMHYTPNGTAQKDRSYCGFVFADPKSVKTRSARHQRPQRRVSDSAGRRRTSRSTPATSSPTTRCC